ncbi:MAG: transposase [Candidatus Thermoplasmatota archaeon]|nr:transposase [Candidatus Thermoplasmatota archaeon]
MSIMLDSSGCILSHSLNGLISKSKKNTWKDYLKLHATVDVNTGSIHPFTSTTGKKHDSSEFKQLMNYIPQVSEVMTDKAYPS